MALGARWRVVAFGGRRIEDDGLAPGLGGLRGRQLHRQGRRFGRRQRLRAADVAPLADDLQRVCRITIAGPSTLSALLNSLQMGFRTLALEKRSSEVWQVLGAVKTEFGKFGEVLAKTRKKLAEATSSIDLAEVRTRAMARQLRGVESLPEAQTQALLPGSLEAGAEAEDEDERMDDGGAARV